MRSLTPVKLFQSVVWDETMAVQTCVKSLNRWGNHRRRFKSPSVLLLFSFILFLISFILFCLFTFSFILDCSFYSFLLCYPFHPFVLPVCLVLSFFLFLLVHSLPLISFSSFIHSFFLSFSFIVSFCFGFHWFLFSHSFLNPFQGRILSLFKVFSFNIPPVLNYLSFPESFRFLVSFLHSFSHFISSLSFSHLRSFIIMSCSFICIFCSFSFVYFVGVSPAKDFHSRIGIFESCRYSTDSQIICLGAWSKYITKSQVRHSHNYWR